MLKQELQVRIIYIYWGGPEGFKEERRTQLPDRLRSVAIADFNNDGSLIFLPHHITREGQDVDLHILYARRQYRSIIARAFHPFGVTAWRSFNEDGWIDIAVANHKT